MISSGYGESIWPSTCLAWYRKQSKEDTSKLFSLYFELDATAMPQRGIIHFLGSWLTHTFTLHKQP